MGHFVSFEADVWTRRHENGNQVFFYLGLRDPGKDDGNYCLNSFQTGDDDDDRCDTPILGRMMVINFSIRPQTGDEDDNISLTLTGSKEGLK